MATHELKCWPNAYDAIASGAKRFEWRQDDRGYEVGDVLILKRYEPSGQYGAHYANYPDESPRNTQRVRVTYILRGLFGVPPGFCVMSIAPEQAAPPSAPPPSPSDENAGAGASDERRAKFCSDRDWKKEAAEQIDEEGWPTERESAIAYLSILLEESWIDGHHYTINSYEKHEAARRKPPASADAATIAGLRKAAEDIGVVAGGLAERGEHHDAESLRRIAASLRPEPGGGK